jgi:hypothetical protein
VARLQVNVITLLKCNKLAEASTYMQFYHSLTNATKVLDNYLQQKLLCFFIVGSKTLAK